MKNVHQEDYQENENHTKMYFLDDIFYNDHFILIKGSRLI
jgi:hypothetical protein